MDGNNGEAQFARMMRLAESHEPDFDFTKYVKDGKHRQGCPSWLTERQLDILMATTPGPLGLGMSNAQAARFFKLNRKTVQRVLRSIKEKFPVAWERLESIKRVTNRHRHGLHLAYSVEDIRDKTDGFLHVFETEEFISRTGGRYIDMLMTSVKHQF